jgi:hypothetical protein
VSNNPIAACTPADVLFDEAKKHNVEIFEHLRKDDFAADAYHRLALANVDKLDQIQFSSFSR